MRFRPITVNCRHHSVRSGFVHHLSLSAAVLLGLVGFTVGPGCDSSSPGVPGGPGDFFITPNSITLQTGQSVATFSVVGGEEPMKWAVGDPAIGSITDTTGRIANYNRAGSSKGANEITCTDKIGRVARAVVSQSGAVEGLFITPERVVMTESNQVVQLTAVGGEPPYAWTIIDPSLGTLSNSDKSAVNYTRKGGAEGQNIVELKDNSQTLATATIVQE
jgi:hypothetical protein